MITITIVPHTLEQLVALRNLPLEAFLPAPIAEMAPLVPSGQFDQKAAKLAVVKSEPEPETFDFVKGHFVVEPEAGRTGVVEGFDEETGVVTLKFADGTSEPFDAEGIRAATPEEAVAYNAAKPKGRGRPAGSKNKPKAEPKPKPEPEPPALEIGDTVIVGDEEGIYLGMTTATNVAKVKFGKVIKEVGINRLELPPEDDDADEPNEPGEPEPTVEDVKEAMQAFLDGGGAVTAMRAVLRKHGAASGKVSDVKPEKYRGVIAALAIPSGE